MSGILLLRESAKRETAFMLAGMGATFVLVAALLVIGLTQAYRETKESGRARVSNLARLLEEQTRRTVQAIDFTLLDIVRTLRDAPATRRHDPDLTARLRERLAELPYVRALFVIDADGRIVQDTDSNTPNVSLADRDYFRVHRDSPNTRLHIGQPLQSRSVGAPWFLSVSRGIVLDDGRLHGVAVAALEPKYFARFYDDVVAGKAGSLALLHEAEVLIARSPEHGVGLSLAGATLFARHLPRAEAGTFEEASKVDGLERIFGYRRVSPLPLIVTAGISSDTLLAGWWEKLYISIAGAVAFLLALFVTGLMLVRHRTSALLSTERLQQIEKTEALGQMTSSIAHDFNNFLTVIGGNLDLIALRLPSDDPGKARLARARDTVHRAGRLVNQLVAFARHEPLAAVCENPARLVGELSELLNQAARPCELSFSLPADGWNCTIDTSQFERALLNLVVNARDASAPGGCIQVSVANIPVTRRELAVWPDLSPGDYVVCSVRDEGAGMSPEVARRAFEPFFTTKTEGRGTGLGLSQVFGFARKSGGGVHIESKVGRGSVITLLLPKAAGAVAAPESPVTATLQNAVAEMVSAAHGRMAGAGLPVTPSVANPAPAKPERVRRAG